MPEAHLIALGASHILHLVRPLRTGRRPTSRIGGAILVGLGAALAVWATRAAGNTDLEHPNRLVTGGPYAVSRNPMYVGWTSMYVGYAFLFDMAWPLVLLPGLATGVHREVAQEERRLEEHFGSDYRAYVRGTRRYL